MRPRTQTVLTSAAPPLAVPHVTAQTIGTVITALTAIGALLFTGLSLYATQQQNKVTEQGQYTDRYTNAVEQLDQSGPDHLQGRLGAVYSLERLARDSPRDQPTIIEMLSAFVRTSRPTPTTPPSGGFRVCPPTQRLTSDIQAALAVLGRRDHRYDNNTRVDLTRICLNGTDLSHMNLDGADLSEADLTGADLAGGTLERTKLYAANLVAVDLSGAKLRDADLNGATLEKASLVAADLHNADLAFATLHGAALHGADLGGADLHDANLTGATFRGADLRGADLSSVLYDAKTDIQATKTDPTTIGQWW